MNFLLIVLAIIVGHMIWAFIEERRDYKYKWTCPKCNKFKASSNDVNILRRVEEGHNCE